LIESVHPRKPLRKEAQKVKQQHERLTKHQVFPCMLYRSSETTDLARRAAIDEFYFTWHREILYLLI
jgi:hypothetical protein